MTTITEKLKCNNCGILEDFTPTVTSGVLEKYIELRIKAYSCKKCRAEGHQIQYGEGVYVCPSCNLDSEAEVEDLNIKGDCVCCDKCDMWFHGNCANFDPKKKDDNFFCPGCVSVEKEIAESPKKDEKVEKVPEVQEDDFMEDIDEAEKGCLNEHDDALKRYNESHEIERKGIIERFSLLRKKRKRKGQSGDTKVSKKRKV